MRLLHYPGVPEAKRNELNPGIGVRPRPCTKVPADRLIGSYWYGTSPYIRIAEADSTQTLNALPSYRKGMSQLYRCRTGKANVGSPVLLIAPKAFWLKSFWRRDRCTLHTWHIRHQHWRSVRPMDQSVTLFILLDSHHPVSPLMLWISQ